MTPAPRTFSWRQTLPPLLLALAVALYAIYFSWLTLTRYHALESRALDMGNLNQAIWNTAHGNWFHQTNQPGVTNRLSLHVEPLILPIALLYRLWPGPEFLLVLQATVVAAGAIPLYALARRETGSPWLALLFGVAWLLMPAMQGANWYEFHPVTLAPTFFLAAFYFLVARRPGWYALFAVLAAAGKEDLGLLIFMVGLYAWLAQKQRTLGLVSMALGMGWSLVAVLGIQNAFGGNIHWGRYTYLGETPAEMLRSVITQPGLVWTQVQKANALGYLYELLLPVGFLALLAPEVLLLALPSLGVNLLADFAPMHEVDTLIYAAPIAPFVALAAVMGTARLLRWLRREEAGRLPRRAAPWAVGGLVLLCLGVAQAQYGYLPGGANFRLYPITARDRLAQTLFVQIPPQAAVSAQDKLNPHTSGRTTSYIFPRVLDAETGDADHVLIDAAGPSWPQHPNDVYASVQALRADGWGVVDGAGGYLLLRRGEPNQEIPLAFYAPWRRLEDDAPAFAQAAHFGPLLLTGVDIFDDDHGETVVRTHWQATQHMTDPLTIRLRYLDADGGLLYDSVHSPPVIGLWYPTTAWPPNEAIIAESVPWPMPDGRLTLLVSVTAGAAADAPALPVTEPRPMRPLPDGGNALRVGAFERAAQGWQPVQAYAAPAASVDARFGDVALAAAEVLPLARRAATATATVALAWQAISAPVRDDSIFIHLLDANGVRVAQWDGAPRDAAGPLPMTAWPVGMVIVGHYPLALPAGLPRGEYRLVAGVYNWAGGAAVPADGRDAVDGQAAAIGTLRIE